MIEIIYGSYEPKKGEKVIKEKTTGFQSYIKHSMLNLVLDNIYIPLTKEEIEWICINGKANIKIILKDKRLRFTKISINKLNKKQKHKQIIILRDYVKKENIFKYLNDIVYNKNRLEVYNKLIDNKVPLFPLVNQLLLFIDNFKGQEEIFMLLDKMMFISDKTTAEILSFNLKPIDYIINFWSRKNED